MIRSTTPTHIFRFRFDPAECDRIVVMYEQNGKEILQKEKEDMVIDSEKNTASVVLSQEESNLFEIGQASVQVKVRINGSVRSCRKKTIVISPIIDDTVI